MKYLILFFLLPATLSYSSCESNTKKTDIKSENNSALNQEQVPKVQVIPADEYKKAVSQPEIQLVDVRTPEEYNNGHIGNALNIDYYNPEFKNQIAKLDKTKPVYIYCRSGSRSQSAAKIMEELGFVSIIDLKGGYMKYK